MLIHILQLVVIVYHHTVLAVLIDFNWPSRTCNGRGRGGRPSRGSLTGPLALDRGR